MTAPITGGCLCGAIRYAIAAPLASLRVCHCTHCQKTSGTGSSVNAVIQSKDFTLTRGSPKRYAARADSGRILSRYFCADCGSPIYSQRENSPERMVVRAGSLDDSATLKIVANIWTKSARPWSWIDPATEQLPGNPN
ncbi:MAG TPA: GFA family protein [Burkholderiales bacterium]|jgi:hypothetical protein